jgi:YHS domain-containing protein
MKNILYIIALILAVAVFLSASGCAEKTQATGNEIQGASEGVTPAETPAAMISTDSTSSKVVDVVCKMKVEKSVIDTSVYKGKTYYFCSPYCKQEFDKNPEKYINSQNST